jgi:hypothetical protein
VGAFRRDSKPCNPVRRSFMIASGWKAPAPL